MSFKDFFKKEETKSVPPISAINEVTRDGIPKAFIPEFLYKPPYGYPRYTDITEIRRLAATPFVEMCISTIINEITALEWDIVTEDEDEETSQEKQKQIDHVKAFFMNPNTNKESFNDIVKKVARDILEIDSGIINKVFNKRGQMVEIMARDGATFTKNPDAHGLYVDRYDIIKYTTIGKLGMSERMARERAAYFQYGWITGPVPIPFGKKELVWLEQNPRTDSLYGRSPIEVLNSSLKILIYSIETNLEYYNANSIPKGVIGLDGASDEQITSFKRQWEEQQKVKDPIFGGWKKLLHKVPVVNKTPNFTRIQFSNQELEMISQQEWFSKMVWACFGVTPSELGYTENSNKATEIVQSSVFKRKAINPLVRLLEYRINHEIVSEFEYTGIQFKFKTFDIGEELKKTELYEKQISNGLRTVNEIRKTEGLGELEWGDEPPKNWQQQPSWGFPGANNFSQETTAKEPKEPTGKERIDQENKSISEDNPLILRAGEKLDDKRLKKSIDAIINANKKAIIKIIESEIGKDNIKEIKSVDEVIKYIKSLMEFDAIRKLSDEIIKKTYSDGWEKSEKQLGRNFVPNEEAVKFLQDYTFTNIKDMGKEITNDLRAEIQRGIMNGEGISDLKARINKVFDIGLNRSEMIARTEINRAENTGTLQAMKSSGEKMTKTWNAAKDERTSEICKRLDGQTVGINDQFIDTKTGNEFQNPPAHVNCRSVLTYKIEPNKKEETNG